MSENGKVRHPFRGELDFCLAATDIHAAGAKYDELVSAAEELGFHVQGGLVSVMPRSDVLGDSPLHRDLADPLLTLEEAAAQLALDPDRIWDALQAGVPHVQVAGQTRVRASALTYWLVPRT